MVSSIITLAFNLNLAIGNLTAHQVEDPQSKNIYSIPSVITHISFTFVKY